MRSFVVAYTPNKKLSIGEDKAKYSASAQGLNDQLKDIKEMSTKISGRYSRRDTAIGWMMIAGGLLAMAFSVAAVLASFGLLTVPGLSAGFLGANLLTAGVVLAGAGGSGLFAGGVAMTVKGAEKGAAKAAANLVDVTVREAGRIFPHEARQLLKP